METDQGKQFLAAGEFYTLTTGSGVLTRHWNNDRLEWVKHLRDATLFRANEKLERAGMVASRNASSVVMIEDQTARVKRRYTKAQLAQVD